MPPEMDFASIILGKLKKVGLVRLPSKKIGEVTKRDGSDEKNIMIRVKPEDEKNADLDSKKEIMSEITKILKKIPSIKNIKMNEKSPNSSKFPSVSFTHEKRAYDIVIATGGNAGEKYEKDLLVGLMIHHLEGITDEYLEELEIQMEELDPTFKSADVIKPRSREGSTKRSDVNPGDIGPIIADIVFEMKDGSERYVSVKNKKGATFANLGGVGPAFSHDYTVDKSSEIGKLLLSAGFDLEKIKEGLKAYDTGKKIKFEDVIDKDKPITITSPLYKFLLKSWGWGYFYVRELKPGFKVKYISEELVKDVLLSGLYITQIRYPSNTSKQISVKFGNELISYSLELRNSAGLVRPNDAKVKIIKMNF